MKWTTISKNDYQTLNYYENFIPSKLTPIERPKINLISKKPSWFKRAKGNFRNYEEYFIKKRGKSLVKNFLKNPRNDPKLVWKILEA